MTRSRALWILVVITVLAAPAIVSLRGEARPSERWSAGVSPGIEVRLPAGWHVAGERLVPKLLQPREVISAGTGRLEVGGGGNCGRYPIAALRRLGSNDRLFTIQRRPGHPGSRWFDRLPQWPGRFELPPAKRGAEERWATAELQVKGGRHLYWILVAFGRTPTPEMTREAERILGTVRLDAT